MIPQSEKYITKERTIHYLRHKDVYKRQVIHDDAAHNIKHLSWLIAHEYNHFTLGSNEIIQSSLNNLMITITRLYEFQNTDATPLESKNHEIDKIIKYIHSNFGKKITLELLASDMHLSLSLIHIY